MREYPRGPLSKRDYENLLSMPEYADRARADLARLAEIDDTKVMVEQGTPEAPKSIQIENPLPIWKRIGFNSKEELLAMSRPETSDSKKIDKA